MAGEAEELISIFRSQLILKRYDDSTLRVLHTIMHSKDVGLLLSVRSLVREILQSTAFESLKGVEVLEKTVEEKLQIIGFFVHAFALAGDVENSLALKYEALVLRDHVFVNSPHLQVSYDEWLKFAEDSLNNGFYLNAIQGYDHAVLSLQSTHPNHGVSCVQAHEVEEIKKLKDATRTLVTSQSVQAQTAIYLKKKAGQLSGGKDSKSLGPRHLASSLFRSGIKKHNLRKFEAFSEGKLPQNITQ